MLSIDDFKRLTIDDKKIFDEFYKKYPPFHSDYVFTTLVSWMEYADYHYAVFDKNLILYSDIDGQIRFRPPIGEYKKEVFDQVLSLSQEQNSDFPFGMISQETKDRMKKEYPGFEFIEHRGFFDYVYLAEDLAELNGSSYSKIRNRLNKYSKCILYNRYN